MSTPNSTMHFQRPQPPGADAARTAKRLFAVSLVLVAVLSSLLWWLIRHDSGAADPQAGPPQAGESPTPGGGDNGNGETEEPEPTVTLKAGRFTFEGLAPVQRTEDCAGVSYGDVKGWFRKNPCEQVARALFSVRDGSGDGARAAVSVSVVTMPGKSGARKLKRLTDTSGTGNVTDLVKDGTVKEPGVPDVAGGAYASYVNGNELTIVESAFFGDTKNKALLEEITAQGLQVGQQLD